MLLILFGLSQVVLFLLFILKPWKTDKEWEQEVWSVFGSMIFYLASLTCDALFKLYFSVVLLVCIYQYKSVMKFRRLSDEQSVDVRPKMIVPVLISVVV